MNTGPKRRVLMNFQLMHSWSAHFLEEDCKTPVSDPVRFYDFKSLEDLRAMVGRTLDPDYAVKHFDRDVRRWARGSVWLEITEEQYQRLKGKRPM
jgi:hypothetical protein